MPTPSRTSLEEIVRVGTALLEEGGPESLTMQAVATRAGVRAPSLYKHVRSRGELIQRITEAAVVDLGRALERAAPVGADPAEALEGAARALRAFAHARPESFRLALRPGPEAARARPEVAGQAVAPVLRAAALLAGEDDALAAARTFAAWASGFIDMELADAFRMGGDVDQAFEFGLRSLLAAMGDVRVVARPR